MTGGLRNKGLLVALIVVTAMTVLMQPARAQERRPAHAVSEVHFWHQPTPRPKPKSKSKTASVRLSRISTMTKADERLILRGWNSGPDVRLSFDDCATPSKLTSLLRLMRQDRIEAIFFFTGVCMEQHPTYRAQILRSHQLLGNHSFDHSDYAKLSDAQIKAQLLKGVKPTTTPMLARPPYGDLAFTTRFWNIAAGVGMRPVFWTVDTRDWAGLSSSEIEERVLSGESGKNGTSPAKAGGLILMHGTGEHTFEALPTVIAGMRHKGLDLFPLR